MKWIGQHIYDLVSRFRNDVYLENLSTTTGTDSLVIDSDGKISKNTSIGGDITSLGTLTALDVDSINLNDKTITITGDTSDTLTIVAGAGGATTMTTTDAGGTTGHFEIAADGNITLDAAGDIALEAAGNDITVDSDTLTITSSTADYPQIKVLNTTDDDQAGQLIFEKLRDDDAVATGQNLGEIWFRGQDAAQNTEDYGYIVGEIDVGTSGQESGQLVFGVAGHDGSNRTAMTLTGGSEATEVDATIGLGANSIVTIPGAITIGSTGAIIGAGIPNVYGSVIKLLPTDFMDNGDGGNTKFGIGYTDSAGTGYGMRVPNGATEMYAFVFIPEGMKATHVDIYDKTDLAIEVFEVQINATTMVSKGSGNCNTTLDITDVNSTATNMLAIEITTTATTDRVYGGIVTIAAQ